MFNILGFQNLPKHQRLAIGINRLKIGMFHCEMHFLVFCFTSSKKFSFNAGATRVDFSIYPHGHPRYNGEKMGSCFHFFRPSKKRAFRIDVCNMCLPWAITNWVWEFYSFKNALGAQSLSQRPRHGLGTDGKIFLILYDFLNILTRSI